MADAGDDESAGPIMRLVVEYQPENYMALYHAGMSEYILGHTDLARTHLQRFLAIYHPRTGGAPTPRGAGAPRRAMTATRGYLAPGALLRGRYEIVREIGRGGYSIVYQARDRDVGGEVALKLLVPPPATAHLARERMRREVHAVRGLSHANIVAVYDLLDEEPWSFIVMEYVAGSDLHVRVRERGPLLGATRPCGSAGTWRRRWRRRIGAASCIGT